MLSDLIYIFGASAVSASVAEFLNWVMIYRTDEYQKLKNATEKIQKKLDKKKESVGANSKDKKVNRFEESLKEVNRDLSMVKMKSMFAVAIVMISLFGFLSSTFDGQVVCKLPFTPFGIFTGISHRNLPGQDYTDCSFVFFYIICSMAIRNNLQKILGFAPPKQANNQFQTPFS